MPPWKLTRRLHHPTRRRAMPAAYLVEADAVDVVAVLVAPVAADLAALAVLVVVDLAVAVGPVGGLAPVRLVPTALSRRRGAAWA